MKQHTPCTANFQVGLLPAISLAAWGKLTWGHADGQRALVCVLMTAMLMPQLRAEPVHPAEPGWQHNLVSYPLNI